MRPFMPHGRHTDGRTQGLRQPRGITLLHKRSAEGGDTASIPCGHEDDRMRPCLLKGPAGPAERKRYYGFLTTAPLHARAREFKEKTPRPRSERPAPLSRGGSPATT